MTIVSREEQKEEQFLLRVKDDSLAKRLRQLLQGSEQEASNAIMNLQFHGERTGALTVDGVQYPVIAQHLPSVVESYKTYDNINLVKSTDIGQVLLVHPPDTSLPDEPALEAADGLTPPMHDARRRQFKPLVVAPQKRVSEVEKDMFAILNGKAPRGVEFIDVEEEYTIVDGKGRWMPVPKKEPTVATATQEDGAAEDVTDELLDLMQS